MVELSPEGVVRAYFDALNRRDYSRAAGCIAEHCVWESLGSHTQRVGPAAVVAGLRDFVTAFPDWRAELQRVMSDGNCVVIEWATSGTFEKPFRDRAPNGKRFERRGCAVAEVSGGKISRYRDYYDRAIMLQQLDMMDLL
jgi:steroid delta-isomerase-like uncharacterized protein